MPKQKNVSVSFSSRIPPPKPVYVAPPPAAPAPDAFTVEAADTSSADTYVYYPNCSAARAAGAAPIYEGEPGYAPELDRDRDGIACE